MKIHTLMIPDPITVSVNASISEAIELMKINSIRHLPVVSAGNHLEGFLTLADLKQGLIPSMVSDLSLRDLMIIDPITVDPDEEIEYAAQLIYNHKIGGLPVTKDNKLVGIITDRDLKRASASDANSLEIHELVYLLSKIKVKEIMTKEPITIPLYYTLEETSRILLEKKISGVPVVDEQGQVIGIITRDDLLKVLINMTGVDKRGVQFDLQVEDRPKSVHELSDVIRKYGGRMVSLLTSHEKAPPGYRNVCIRAYRIDRKILPQLLEDLEKKATLLHLVDHREDLRDIRYSFK